MAVQARKMTVPEYFTLPESNRSEELVDGEHIVRPSPSPAHQLTVGNLLHLLDTLIPDGEVLCAPLDVYIDEYNVVQPDVMWFSAEKMAALHDAKYVKVASDLIVEVLSRGTARHDRREKFHLYEKIGVREYWTVDIEENLLEIWKLQDGHFALVNVFGIDDECQSPLLGKVSVRAIFEN